MSTDRVQDQGILIPSSNARSKTHKRLRLAFTAVLFSRKLLFAAKQELNSKISTSLSYIAIDIEPQTSHTKFGKASLSKLVEEENLDQLQCFGGTHEIVVALGTDAENGIKGDSQDLLNRQVVYGSNTYEKPPLKSFFYFALKAFKDPITILMIVLAIFSISFGARKHALEGGSWNAGSIFLAASIAIMSSSFSNFWPYKQFNKLSRNRHDIKVYVLRNGWRQPIPSDQIVVGDVVCLQVGDKIPADGLLLHSHSLSILKPSLAPNSDVIEVNSNRTPFLHSGSMVVNGHAKMLVTSVGMNTTWGKIITTKWKDSSQERTPLQVQLHTIATLARKFGLLAAFIVFLRWSCTYFMGEMRNGYVRGETEFREIASAMVGILAPVIAIAAGAVAEGLPLAFVIALAYSMKSMANNQAFVQKRSACEVIASATTICTKFNQMQVKQFWLGQEFIEQGSSSKISQDVIELLHQAVGLRPTVPVPRDSSFIWTPIEEAVMCWASAEMGMNAKELEESCEILKGEALLSLKTCGWFLMKKCNDNTVHMHWKGTPESILLMCTRYYDSTGTIKAIDYDARAKLCQVIEAMAADGLQCIAFAHKETSRHLNEAGRLHHVPEDSCLNFIGIVGIRNMCQLMIEKAIADWQNAGVNTKMVTKDDILIARATATECGIIKPGQFTEGEVVVSAEFQNYTPEERMEKVEKIRVIASATPLDVLLLIRCLKEKGHVVGAIGNETEDAAALREANVGICLGLQATNTAKESSDIVILDNDFCSIGKVLKWGRTMFNHVQIFVQFQLTLSITSIVIDFVTAVSASEPPTIKIVASISSGKVPFAALQLLWVKLVIGTMAALALSLGKPFEKTANRPVYGKPLITNMMWNRILVLAMYQIAILLTIQFKSQEMFRVNNKVKDTLMFNTFVLCQVFNKCNARELNKKGILKRVRGNKLFLSIIGTIIILQVVMVEFLKFAGTEKLTLVQWGASIVLAAMTLPIGWCVKCIPVPNKPYLNYLKFKN